jgi:hypothetical protein
MGGQSTERYGYAGNPGYDSSGRAPVEKGNLDPSGYAFGVPMSPVRSYSVYPVASNTSSLATAQEPTAGSLGVTLTAGTNVVSTTLLIGGNYVTVFDITAQSSSAITVADQPDKLQRCVTITGTTNTTSQLFTVVGYDMYYQAVTCTFNGPLGATTTSSPKTFSYVASITAAADPGANITAGVGDIYGFPVAVYTFDQFLDLYWNQNSIANIPNNFTGADQTQPTSATTGDVRGTYNISPSFSTGVSAFTAHIWVINPNNMNFAYGYKP